MSKPPSTVSQGIGALSLASACLAFSSAQGQSFDCDKVTTPVEHAICNDHKLADLDDRLAKSLRKLISADPEMHSTLLEDEGQWIRDRDHHCTTQRGEQSLEDCLGAEYTARLAGLAIRAHEAAARRAHNPVCQVIADRYRPLANAHPGEAPINVLADSPTSGVQLAGSAELAELHSTNLAAWAASQKPPFSVSPALLNSLQQFEQFGGSGGLIKAPGVDFYSIAGFQGSEGCANSQSFVIRGGVAFPSDTPGERNDECGTGTLYAAVDRAPVAIIQKYDRRPGMTASLDVWTWNGQAFSDDCEVSLTYKPRFTEKSLNNWSETCDGSDCNDLRTASFKLAESAETDPQALQESARGTLSSKQKEQFDAMDQIFGAQDREPSSNDAFSIPFLYHDRLYLASIGHFAIGWRDYADWSVLIEEFEDGKLIPRGAFPVATLKGDLIDATVTAR